MRSSDGPGIARAQPVLFHLRFGIWDLGFGIWDLGFENRSLRHPDCPGVEAGLRLEARREADLEVLPARDRQLILTGIEKVELVLAAFGLRLVAPAAALERDVIDRRVVEDRRDHVVGRDVAVQAGVRLSSRQRPDDRQVVGGFGKPPGPRAARREYLVDAAVGAVGHRRAVDEVLLADAE